MCVYSVSLRGWVGRSSWIAKKGRLFGNHVLPFFRGLPCCVPDLLATYTSAQGKRVFRCL